MLHKKRIAPRESIRHLCRWGQYECSLP